jgi:hypothetical protein
VKLLEAEKDPKVDNQDALLGVLRNLQAITNNQPRALQNVAREPTIHAHPFKEVTAFPIAGETAILEIKEHRASPKFFNWGQTYSFIPGRTLVIRTKEGVCKVVKWAADIGRRVRVAGFRHTWS